MDCRTAQKLVMPYVNKTLDGKTIEEFIHHIRHCRECYEELEIYYTIQVALKQLDEEQEVSYDIKQMLAEDLRLTGHKAVNGRRRQFAALLLVCIMQVSIAITLVAQLQIWSAGTLEGTAIYQLHRQNGNNRTTVESSQEELLSGEEKPAKNQNKAPAGNEEDQNNGRSGVDDE